MSAALLEIAKTGAAEAQRSLAALAGAAAACAGGPRVEKSDPADVRWVSAEVGLAIVLPVRGVVSGLFALFVGDEAARRICASMCRTPVAALGPMEESALLELGNVLASSFVNRAAASFGGPLVPGLPAMRRGLLPELARELSREAGAAWRLCCPFFAAGERCELVVWLEHAAAAKARAAG